MNFNKTAIANHPVVQDVFAKVKNESPMKKDFSALEKKIRELLQERNNNLLAGETKLDEEYMDKAVEAIMDLCKNTPDSVFHKIFATASIDTIIAYVFKERVTALESVLREEARKQQKLNEQVNAISKLKTLLAGYQPSTETKLKDLISITSKELDELRTTAKLADFDIEPYLTDLKLPETPEEQSTSGAAQAKSATFPYSAYQKLNTALAGHTDKYTNLSTSQQFTITELKKRIDQSWEFLSNYSKRLHDTLQTIISNIR